MSRLAQYLRNLAEHLQTVLFHHVGHGSIKPFRAPALVQGYPSADHIESPAIRQVIYNLTLENNKIYFVAYLVLELV